MIKKKSNSLNAISVLSKQARQRIRTLILFVELPILRMHAFKPQPHIWAEINNTEIDEDHFLLHTYFRRSILAYLNPKKYSLRPKLTFCFKVEKILKGSLNSIPSPSSSVKIQIMAGKVCLRCKGKILLGVVNKLLKTKSLLTSPSNVLPYYLK